MNVMLVIEVIMRNGKLMLFGHVCVHMYFMSPLHKSVPRLGHPQSKKSLITPLLTVTVMTHWDTSI